MNLPSASHTSLWRNQAFIRLFSTSFLVVLGSTLYSLAFPLIVYEITKSSELMGIVRAVEFLPNLFLAALIGVWFDRVNRKAWASYMLFGQFFILGGVYLAVELLADPLPYIIVAAFLTMLMNYGYFNASYGIQKKILPQEHQSAAIAKIASVTTSFETVGPAISGFLLLFSKLHVAMVGIALIFLCASWAFSRISYRQTIITEKKASVWTGLRHGWQCLRKNTALWHITLLVIVINTTVSVFEIQAIFTAKQNLECTTVEVGYMLALGGAGGFLGSLLTPNIRKQVGLGATLLAAVFIQPFCFFLPAIALSKTSLIAGVALAGFFSMITNICVWGYRQESTPPEMIGRMAGITGSFFKLGMPFGLALSGYIISLYGSATLFSACAFLQLAAVIYAIFRSGIARLR